MLSASFILVLASGARMQREEEPKLLPELVQLLTPNADAFQAVAARPQLRTRAAQPAMAGGDYNKLGQSKGTKAKVAPDGPFGGFKKPGSPSGFLGDTSKSLQIRKFEEGDDYLFFQGPAPKTAVQEDLPSFFSPENFADLEITVPQIAVTATGLAAAGALAASLAAPDLVEKLR